MENSCNDRNGRFIFSDLILLGGVLRDEGVSAFANAVLNDDVGSYAKACSVLLEKDAFTQFGDYVENVIRTDDNLFARRAFKGTLTEGIVKAYTHDLQVLQNLCTKTVSLPNKITTTIRDGFPEIECGNGSFVSSSIDEILRDLTAFYAKNGYGIFIENKAFTYENGALCPVRNACSVLLSDLKDYTEEKNAVQNNIQSFLQGLPFSNMLLYGDKGTGKSSTIHAMLNEYAAAGLRAVEVTKERIVDVNAIKSLLTDLPFKFLIFIDDLSLEEHDEKVTTLKAALEGSLNAKGNNVMIVATSNRRHILKENFSDRENSVHARDTMEEQLSLSDRFGLSICFSSTGKTEYLSIVRQLADDVQLNCDETRLFALAERWAIVKGGRSPRRAKQFVDYLHACSVKGIEADF